MRLKQLGVGAGLILVLMLAVSADRAVAQDEGPLHFDAIYYPWVPNGDVIDGAGPWHGSITVQNVDVEQSNEGVRFWVFDSRTINRVAMNDDGSGEPYTFEDALDDSTVPRFDIDANASITLSAAALGIAEPGSALAVYAIYKRALDEEDTLAPDLGAPTITGIQKQSLGSPMFNARTTDAHAAVDGYAAIPIADVPWGSQSDFCHEIAGGVDACDGRGLYSLPDGPGSGFDGHSYLPIVQTNSGWNTEIRLSNIDFTQTTAAQVNVTLIASHQQGFGASAEHKVTETFNIPPGGTVSMDVSNWVPDEWVGSAHITSTVGIVTSALRSKVSDSMLMINTAAPSLEQLTGDGFELLSTGSSLYRQYAPLIFKDYNGWNTGFSFVNTSEQTNRVTVTYYGLFGGVVGTDSRTVPPQGQEFIHVPASEDGGSGPGFVGAAVFTSALPFHVAVDQVKYSTGEAMSYLATASGAAHLGDDWPDELAEGALVMPLVQKGMLNGDGDVSGLQLFNASFDDPVTVEVTFFDSAGSIVAPTLTGPIRMTLLPTESATLHTSNLSEMAQNQRSSAVIVPVEGDGMVVGVSNNVNYAVNGDGSSAFNMVNLNGQYRFPAPGSTD